MAHSVRPPTRLNDARAILRRLASGATEIREVFTHFKQCVLCGGRAPNFQSVVEHRKDCIVTEAQRWLDEVP